MSDLPPHPPPPARRSRWRAVLRYGAIALVALATALFFAERHMGELLARKLEEQFSEGGVFISWRSADWALHSGVKLHGLAVYRDAARRDRLALFGKATALLGDSDALTVRMANTTLLLGSGAAETKLEHVDIQLLIQSDKADLQVCRASLKGLRLEALGAFGRTAPAGTAKEDAPGPGLFAKVNLDWLKPAREWLQMQPEADAPVLKLKFQPLPEGGGMNLAMTFGGRRFRWRGLKWDFIQAAVNWPIGGKKSPIEIDHLRAGFESWKAEVAGSFDPAGRVVRIGRLDSEIDPLRLARALVPNLAGKLSAASASGNWRISGAGEFPLDRPESWRWQGGVALRGDFVYASGGTKIVLQKPAFAIRVEEQMVALSDLKVGLWGGNLDAPKLVVHLPSEKTNLRIETQATLRDARQQSISDSFGGARKQPDTLPLKWKGTWRINGAGEIPREHPENWRWNGDVALDGEFLLAGSSTKIALQNPALSLRVDGPVVTLSDFKAGLWDGSLNAPKTVVNLPSAKKNLRVETQATLRDARLPAVIASFGDARKPAGAVPFSARGTWRINGTGEVSLDHPESWRGNGNVALDGEFLYAGGITKIALQNPAFALRMDGPVVTLSDFKAGLWDGSLSAPKTVVNLPSAKTKLRFETQATLQGTRLPSVAASFGGAGKKSDAVPWNWKGTWRMSGAGEVPMEQPENWRWNGDMAFDGDFLFAGGGTKVSLQKTAFALRVDGPVMTLSDFKAGLWDGSLNAPKTVIYLPSAKTKLRFETQATLRDAQLQSVVASVGVVRKGPGTVQCDWKGSGEFALASLAGSGALSIGDTGFAQIPLLGGLHTLFEKLTPRFRSDVESNMTVKHRMAGGALYLEDLKLDSAQTHIEAEGSIDLVRDHAEITAQGRLRGITGLATVILASLLEFQGEGPVRDMHWRLKSIPGVGLIRNTAKKITRKAKEATQGNDDGVKGSQGSAGNKPASR